MDKAEQPTITRDDRRVMAAYYYHPLIANPSMADAVLADNWESGCSDCERAMLETIAAFRTTSLAAQDDWTTKRVAELVAEGDGHWRSCTGCHETNEGAETGDYPFNPVFKTYQGGGCGECGGTGVVWDNTDYADYAEFCLNADDDAPSLAAQDGLVEAKELRRIASIFKQWRSTLMLNKMDGEQWRSLNKAFDDLAALSAIKEQHHD